MSIIVGTASVNGNKVVLTPPMGFGTARGVRISNFTPDTLILNNVSGTDQSQEYLAPQTCMVYRTLNVQQTPYVQGFNYAASQIAPNILLEWSTDPDTDFIGTYPSALPANISLKSLVLASETSASGTRISQTIDLTNAGPQIAISLSCNGTGQTWTVTWLDSTGTPIFVDTIHTQAFDGSSTGNAVCLFVTPCYSNKVKIESNGSGTGTVALTVSRSPIPVTVREQVKPNNLVFNYTTIGSGGRTIGYESLAYGGKADITITANTPVSADTHMRLQTLANGANMFILCDTINATNGSDGNMYAKFTDVEIPIHASNLQVNVPTWTTAVNFTIMITYKD